MEIGSEQQQEDEKAVWCIVATVSGDRTGGAGAGAFEPGTTVFCFPPVRGGAYESVKVVGPHRKTGRIVGAVVAADDLENWRAKPIYTAEVLEQIAPPWDNSFISRGVAEGIAAWKAGGPWPTAELRQWNRAHAEKVVGEGTLLTRLKNAFFRLLGREE